jgi:hypothetical protein
LRAFDGVLKAAQELLQVGAAFHEIDVGGVDHQQIRRGVVKEEMLVSAGDLFNIFESDLGFIARGFFGDARPEYFGFGLEIDDQIRGRNFGSKRFVISVVKF